MEHPSQDHARPDSPQAASGRRAWLALLLAAVCVALFVLVVWPWITQPSPVGESPGRTTGFVLDLKGDWACRQLGSRSLVPGDVLPTGARLEPRDAANAPWIRLILRNGADETYRAPIDLPSVVEPRLTTRFWDALVNNYTSVLRADTLVARGDEHAVVPLDGPVPCDGQALNLSPVFAPMPAGTYQLSFYDLDPRHLDAMNDPTRGTPRFKIDYAWDPERPQPAIIGECTPGLFLAKIAENSANALPGGDFWLLVAPAERFDAVEAAYADALSPDVRAGATPDPASRATARWLRRATLVTLATTDAK